MTPDTSGPASHVPLAYYDPESSCWKTSGAIFPSDWPTSSETCPPWGMTRGGELFALPTPELPTVGHASSSAPSLLPTPRTTDSHGAGEHGQGGMDLRTTISLLPTPAVNDMGEGKTPEAWDEWTARMRARHGNGNGHGNSLAIEAQRLLPTPQADFRDRSDATASSKSVNRDFFDVSSWALTLSTSAPTPPRSGDGKPSPDDQLPGQLSLDEPESA